MSKNIKKRTNDKNKKIAKLPKSVNFVKASDGCQWTAGDGFYSDVSHNHNNNHNFCQNENSDKSSSNNSTSSRISSKNSSNSPKRRQNTRNTSNNKRKSDESHEKTTVNGLLMSCINSKMNMKSLFHQKSRFATCLEEKETNESNIEYNDNESQALPPIETSELSQTIDTSSPIHQSLSDLRISPTSSPNKSQTDEQIDCRKVHTLVNQKMIKYFDDSIEKLNKKLNKKENRSNETSLQTRALKVLKHMKQSRLEFCQTDSLKTDVSKALTLTLTQIETNLGLTVIHSFVCNEDNQKYSQNTPIILVFNEKITEDLTLDCIIRLYPRWTESRIDNCIVITNAFNIQIIEDLKPFSGDDQRGNDENEDIPIIIWQNDRP